MEEGGKLRKGEGEGVGEGDGEGKGRRGGEKEGEGEGERARERERGGRGRGSGRGREGERERERERERKGERGRGRGGSSLDAGVGDAADGSEGALAAEDNAGLAHRDTAEDSPDSPVRFNAGLARTAEQQEKWARPQRSGRG